MFPTHRRFGLSLASVIGCYLAWPLPVRADEIPIAPPPEVQTMTVNKDVGAASVIISWSDGVSPFAVQRSQSPNFLGPTNLTYVTRSTPGGPVSDPVLNDGNSYFFLVSDATAPAEVYSITSVRVTPHEDETITIDGVGFDPSCANNSVYLEGGLSATLVSCSTTQLQAEVPAYSISGNVVVVSPNGKSTPQRKLFAVGVTANPTREEQAHINVDTSHNVFACDQGASDRIWKIDFNSGVASTCTTFGNPVGLPRNENGRFNFGNDTWATANAGTVRELDPTSCTFTTWGTSGNGTTDPVDPRALAYDKSGANNGWTFVLDHWGDRIRRKGNGPGIDTMWLAGLGLGGDSPAASRPAGFTFNTAGEFFFTAQSKIRHFSAARTLIQEFTTADGLNRPAQIETDENGALWVANRDAGNVLRIRTDPANKHVHTKVSGLTAPRGIALDRDPGTNDPWLYVADRTQVYRFRVYDTLHLDVKVLNEARTSPSGVTTSEAEFERRVRRDMETVRTVLSQCGIDVVLDRVLFIPDPNASGGAVNATPACTVAPTPEEELILDQGRSSNLLAINVYYVNHFVDASAMTLPRSGFAFTNDCFGSMNNQTDGGVIIARYGSSTGLPGGGLIGAAIDTTAAHELGHFLLDHYVQSGFSGEHYGPPPCGTPPCPDNACTGAADEFHLMHGVGCRTRYTVTAPECSNMRTNADESTFVELF